MQALTGETCDTPYRMIIHCDCQRNTTLCLPRRTVHTDARQFHAHLALTVIFLGSKPGIHIARGTISASRGECTSTAIGSHGT